MSRVAKIPQYREFNDRRNCFGRFQNHQRNLRDWRKASLPLMLELGAGAALTSLTFSSLHKDWQVLAVDRKSDRLNKAARSLDNSPTDKLVFLQADIRHLSDFLDLGGAVNLLWLAFPDPYPSKRQTKHRLVHPLFLDLYESWLVPEGVIRIKTDSRDLFEYARETIAGHRFLSIVLEIEGLSDEMRLPADVLQATTYEVRFKKEKKAIYYLEVTKTG